MADRKTVEFTTPLDNKVVLHAYLTGYEAQELKSIMFSSLNVNMQDMSSGKIDVGNMPTEFLMKQERKAFEFLLVSFNNKSGPAAVEEMLKNWPATEYQAVLEEINKIQNPTAPTK